MHNYIYVSNRESINQDGKMYWAEARPRSVRSLTAQGVKGKRVISGLWRVAGWARLAKWVRKNGFKMR